MAAAVLAAAPPLASVDLLVAEWPVIYPQLPVPSAPLMDLAAVAQVILSAALAAGVTAWAYEPSQWKGRAPKDVFQTQILAALTADEQAVARYRRLSISPEVAGKAAQISLLGDKLVMQRL